MPRSAAIGKLALAFDQAGAARDWERLDALARALGPQLAAWKARGPWTAAELKALAQLRIAHDSAAAGCGDALASLGARLAEMRNNKDGWIAYALASENEPAGQHE
ncbi:hypothetical protein G4G28_06330 [Massilia sp. Dwa41.01b]|uniref:hypothetical protein n=1 Tax=unclassified Massilia TaxID=2609279 RepID=UPI001602F060|nr:MULTISPECIES: hypothetical protein [unclassified Massilia]QNA88209.1 hypothetical protein G4G28_06330 [Massilia sp. Dwa41.01b]QNA99111.1 hypothetical protein G4G31_10055 [Massilia sp. Se16.2.3]